MSEPIKHRYDFEVLLDVKNGNPNGDPDAGGQPRIDEITGNGIITDVCLKRKIRNYVATVKEGIPGYDNYIKSGISLERTDKQALKQYGIDVSDTKDNKLKEAVKNARANDPDIDKNIRDYMCKNYFDIRAFGAVMTTFSHGALNCGQVRGPVQIGFSESIDPIYPREITITRMATTKEEKESDEQNKIGRKYIVPYALYRVKGHVSANIARKTTGFSEEDLELLWKAIINMFEHDHSSARGEMVVRELIVFEHDSELGNAPAHKLFDRVKVEKKEGVETPTNYDDYVVTIDETDMPNGVHMHRMV